MPFDKVNIPGNYWEMETLHYQLNKKYNLLSNPGNGFCSSFDYYSQFDDADNRKNVFGWTTSNAFDIYKTIIIV